MSFLVHFPESLEQKLLAVKAGPALWRLLSNNPNNCVAHAYPCWDKSTRDWSERTQLGHTHDISHCGPIGSEAEGAPVDASQPHSGPGPLARAWGSGRCPTSEALRACPQPSSSSCPPSVPHTRSPRRSQLKGPQPAVSSSSSRAHEGGATPRQSQ